LTQQVIEPQEKPPEQTGSSGPLGRSGPLAPLSATHRRLSKGGVFSLLLVIGALLLLFSGKFTQSIIQVAQNPSPTTGLRSAATRTGRTVTPTASTGAAEAPALIVPGHPTTQPLQLPDSQYVIYEQGTSLYLVSASGDYAKAIPTQGFINSNAAPPVLTPGGQLLYSGDGIWMTDVFDGTPTQIAKLDPGQVITSMALSDDGKMLAWSTEPANGIGQIEIHAGPLADPSVVYTQSALDCPCFRIFSFMHGNSASADSTLLLTDDRGSHEAVQYGMWSLDFSSASAAPQPVLGEDSQQGPLALMSFGNTLLYSTSEGAVAEPTDKSVPYDIASLPYANSLSIASLSGSPLSLSSGQVVLPEQESLSNTAQYHWVTTPVFSPDTRYVAYVEFSSDNQEPYDRHSAIYLVSISGAGGHLRAGKPRLLATSTDQLVELGPWLNTRTLTFYADGALYAVDIQNGSYTNFAQPNDYAHIVGVIGSVA
jgi:hypothetical protein